MEQKFKKERSKFREGGNWLDTDIFRNDRDLQDKLSLLLSKCSQDMINLTYLEEHIIYF